MMTAQSLAIGAHPQCIGAVAADIFFPVAWVGSGQGAQRHHPRHEASLGVRFAGPDELAHLIGNGEASPRLGRGFADRLD